MGFLSPWFLLGLGALSLPFWLHLLRQYRAKPRPFSSLMFFERRIQSSVKHRRLRYLVLMSLRMALLALLALAFAKPFLARHGATARVNRLAVIALDRSFSMRYGDHFAEAKRRALAAVDRLAPDRRAQALAVDSQAQQLTEPTSDKAQLHAAIEAVTPGDRRSSYGELVHVLRTLSQGEHMPLEVRFFTDAQKSSMPAGFADLQLPAGSTLEIESVASGHESNAAVESVSAPAHLYDPKKAPVAAVIANYGNQPAHRTASLVVDNRVLESKLVDVPANGRAAVEFTSLDSPYGFHHGEVRIEPGDSLAEDDRFRFAIERSDPRRVLFLHEAGQNRAALYYRTAIESSTDAGFEPEDLAVAQSANLAFSKYAFIVLSDVRDVPGPLEAQLRQYVGNGGALLVLLGPASVALPHIPVAGNAVLASGYSSRSGDRFQAAASVDADHPALARVNRFDGVQFFQTVRFDPAGARVIASLSDKTPLLAEKQVGEGRVLIFASTFDNVSNDLPVHAAFVPFVVESARYLAGDEQRPANVAVDSIVELRRARERGAAVDVIDPAGRHALALDEAVKAQTFQVDSEGFYEAHLANGRQQLVAVHADRAESDLATVPADLLSLWTHSGGDAPGTSSPAHADNLALWRDVLVLALIVALAETFVASRHAVTETKPVQQALRKTA